MKHTAMYYLLLFLFVFFLGSCQLSDNSPSESVNYLAKDDETRADDHQPETHLCTGAQGFCVSSVTWGGIDVDGSNGAKLNFKDGMIWWAGAKAWDWRVGDVHHDPGITVQALQPFLDMAELTDIILTRGMEGVLKVPSSTLDAALKAGKRVHVAFTRDAVKLYNQLIKEGKKVGGLFHTTC